MSPAVWSAACGAVRSAGGFGRPAPPGRRRGRPGRGRSRSARGRARRRSRWTPRGTAPRSAGRWWDRRPPTRAAARPRAPRRAPRRPRRRGPPATARRSSPTIIASTPTKATCAPMRKRAGPPGTWAAASQEKRSAKGQPIASCTAGGDTDSAVVTSRISSARPASPATKRPSRAIAGRPTVAPSPDRRGSRRRFRRARTQDRDQQRDLDEQQPAVARADQRGDAAHLEPGIGHARADDEQHQGERHAREAAHREHRERPRVRARLGGRGPQQRGQRQERAEPGPGRDQVAARRGARRRAPAARPPPRGRPTPWRPRPPRRAATPRRGRRAGRRRSARARAAAGARPAAGAGRGAPARRCRTGSAPGAAPTPPDRARRPRGR